MLSYCFVLPLMLHKVLYHSRGHRCRDILDQVHGAKEKSSQSKFGFYTNEKTQGLAQEAS